MSFEQEIRFYRNTHPHKSLNINNGEFHYMLSGRGDKTLVLLTGGGGVSEAFFKHVLALETNYRILTFDYPTHIKTNVGMANAIVQVIKSENLQNVYFVGQSYGGLIAQTIAKYHPEVVSGLILSNTGTITSDMSESARVILNKMKKKLKKAIVFVKILPFSIIRSLMVKKVLKKVLSDDSRDQEYIKSFFAFMFKQLNREKELYMCALMIDFIDTQRFVRSDFEYLDGKVLLVLSEDDTTFGDEVPNLLIDLMPNPCVQRSIAGGHLSILLNFEAYTSEIKKFVS